MFHLFHFSKLSMSQNSALTALFILSLLAPQIHSTRDRFLAHHQELSAYHNILPHNHQESDGFFQDRKTAPVAGPNPGGNSQILTATHARAQHHDQTHKRTVEEPVPVSGPSSGGNSKITSVSAGPNPGGNSRILAAGGGPNPGGNANILSTVSEIHVAVSEPNPGGNAHTLSYSPESTSLQKYENLYVGSGPNPGGNVHSLSVTSENMLVVVAGVNPGGDVHTFSTTSNPAGKLASIAAVAGPNPGGNAKIFSVNAGPNPGGNLHISSSNVAHKISGRSVGNILTSPGSGPNPGGNAAIFSVNSGPNPGGNLHISSSISHKTEERSLGGALNSPASGPNPRGNGVLPHGHLERRFSELPQNDGRGNSKEGGPHLQLVAESVDDGLLLSKLPRGPIPPSAPHPSGHSSPTSVINVADRSILGKLPQGPLIPSGPSHGGHSASTGSVAQAERRKSVEMILGSKLFTARGSSHEDGRGDEKIVESKGNGSMIGCAHEDVVQVYASNMFQHNMASI